MQNGGGANYAISRQSETPVEQLRFNNSYRIPSTAMKFVKQTLEPEDYYDYADYKQEMSRDQLYV